MRVMPGPPPVNYIIRTMKALKISLERERNYYRWQADRDFFRAGETLTGHVCFDPPGKRPPDKTRIVWSDTFGRRVLSVKGKWNAKLGRLEFTFETTGRAATSNRLEVEINGEKSAREPFVLARPVSAWDDFQVFVWAHYPQGYYDELRNIGVTGAVAYKRDRAENILDNDFLCYVDQVSPEEMSVYHRPYSQYWEKPENPTHPDRKYKWFLYHWDMIRQRYKKARARLRGKSVAMDFEGRKVLCRANCPSDPAVAERMRERILQTVLQHKAERPLFYNLCDEPGTGDQAAPFDFCYCRHCLERFRVWLEKRYGSLPALNREWGTRFPLWRLVVPFTTDDVLRNQRRARDFNFSGWADHREFMDDLMNQTYGRMRSFGREADPSALYGNTGGQPPNAYGGWDYAKLVENVDLHVPYNMFQNDDMLASFRPRTLKMAPYFGDNRRMVRRIWYQALHGDCGQIHWDNHQADGRFLNIPDCTWSDKAKMLSPALKDLTRGLGRQLMSLKPMDTHLAIHHSQASVRANWMMGALAQGEKWIDRDSQDAEAAEYDVLFHVRDSLTKLAADCGLGHSFISYREIEAGDLAGGCRKALFLPHSLAMGAAECDEVRRFAENGGLVIADALPAVMDNHCRLLPAGQLDDLFGVRRERFDYKAACAPILVRSGSNPVGLVPGKMVLRACEPTLKAVGKARAYGKSGAADCLVVNRVGKGLALYLNMELRHCFNWRARVGSRFERDPQDLLSGLMALAGVARRIHLWKTVRGKRVPGVEVCRFSNGPVEMAGVVVNELRLTSGVGEERAAGQNAFDHKSPMTVELPAAAHAYNARTGEYFGKTAGFRDVFDPFDAKVYAFLPYRVTALSAALQGAAVAGKSAAFKVTLAAEGGVPGRHVVRCDVYNPRNQWLSYYSRNVDTDNGRAEFALPLAENDLPGKWRLELKDVVTGLRKKVFFHLKPRRPS